MNFLDYYKENLAALRGTAAEFAAEFPKIAARLELTEHNCQDPYVERLLEGAAYLAARVENKLESGFPRFLETVTSAVAPLATAPVPSYAVLALNVDRNDDRLVAGLTLPRGTEFRCPIPGIRTPCVYSTVDDCRLTSSELVSQAYLTRELETRSLAGVAAALSLGIDAHGATDVDELSFYVDLPDGEASVLQGQLLGDLVSVVARIDGRSVPLADAAVEIPTFREQSLANSRALHGLQTLSRFLAYPQLFRFFRVRGLRSAFAAAAGGQFELEFLFNRREVAFTRSIGERTVRLDCVPAVNVFRKRSDRTEYRGDFENLVQPDRSAPRDCEVYRILSVELFDSRNQTLFTAANTYDGRLVDAFVPHRRPRPSNALTARSSYHGCDVYVSFSGETFARIRDQIGDFAAELECTNRDLPLLLRQDLPLSGRADFAVTGAAFLDQPSEPRLPAVHSGTRSDWEKIGHLHFNFSSILWRPGAVPAGILRNFVRAYGAGLGEEAERLASAIVGFEATPRTFRFVKRGAVYFEEGWLAELTLDESACAGIGHFVFAAVLKELAFSYTPLNSCVEFVLHTDKRKDVCRWRM